MEAACGAVAGAQGIEGVRFKRLIMDESATDRSPNPPEDPSKKRVIFCTGKVLPLPAASPARPQRAVCNKLCPAGRTSCGSSG